MPVGIENRQRTAGGNMRTLWILLASIVLVGAGVSLVSAEIDAGHGSIGGYMVGEYYYVAGHHDCDIEGHHGFWFRRIYLTYDNDLANSFTMRLRLEMNSASDFESSELLTPYVKDAYLGYSVAQHHFVFGIMDPPSFSQVEQVWGYRPLEKTPLDLQTWTSSRDFGISVRGGNRFPYHFMFGNGSGNKAETDDGKKLYAGLGHKTERFFLEGMAQFEIAEKAEDYIYQGFMAYKGPWGRVAMQYAHRTLKQEGKSDLPYNILSTFFVITPYERWEFVGRYDRCSGRGYRTAFPGERIDYIPFADNAESNFLLGAATYKIRDFIWLMPNIKYVFYEERDDGETPGDDLYLNLTLYFKY
jgi:hypothetical protein